MNFFKPIDRVKKFENITKNMDEWQQREVEPQLLKPAAIPPYSGITPKYKCELDKRCVRIVFASEADMKLASKFFYIAESSKGVKYITDISLILEICKEMQSNEELRSKFKDFIHTGRKAQDEDELICDIQEETTDELDEEDY